MSNSAQYTVHQSETGRNWYVSDPDGFDVQATSASRLDETTARKIADGLNALAAQDQMPEGTRVTVKSFPGVWRVNQPVDADGFAYLVASDAVSTEYMAQSHTCSLNVHSRVCTVVEDDQDLSAPVMGDVLRDSGNLEPLITEAIGWCWDCGIDVGGIAAAVKHIERSYDGGLAEFVRNVA